MDPFTTNAQFNHAPQQTPAPIVQPPAVAPQAALAQNQANTMQAQHLEQFNQVQGANLQQQQQSGVRQMGAPIYPSVATIPPTHMNQGQIAQPQVAQQPQLQMPGAVPQVVQQNPQMLQPSIPPQPQHQVQMPQVPQVPQQPQQYHQQPQMPQQPAPAPQQLQPGEFAGQVINHYVQQGADGDFMQALADEAHRQGVPEAQLAQHIDQAIQDGVGNFESVETYKAYMDGMHNLNEYLAQQYGDQGQQVLEQALDRIEKQGGQALLDKFMYDPDMLNPDILMPYLDGGSGAGSQNPYMRHAAPNNRGYAASAAQGVPGRTPAPTAAMGSADVDAELQGLMNPQSQEARAFLQSPAGQQRRLELMVAKNRMTRQTSGMY